MRRCVRRPLRDDSERMVARALSEASGRSAEPVAGLGTNVSPRGWVCALDTLFAVKATGREACDLFER
jgi:hypothetical protein